MLFSDTCVSEAGLPLHKDIAKGKPQGTIQGTLVEMIWLVKGDPDLEPKLLSFDPSFMSVSSAVLSKSQPFSFSLLMATSNNNPAR